MFFEVLLLNHKNVHVIDMEYTVCKNSILTLGKEAIMLGCDIIMGKCLLYLEAFGVSPHFNTSYNFTRYLHQKLQAFERAVVRFQK